MKLKTIQETMQKLSNRVIDYVVSYSFIGMFKVLDIIPYSRRVPTGGWLMERVLSRALGYRNRVLENLAYIYPAMPPEQSNELMQKVCHNVGRCIVELSSPTSLMDVASKTPLSGTGVNALLATADAGKPVILVSGHLGNYDAVRYNMIHRGYKVGGLYRKMGYRIFNSYYVSRISAIGGALFARDRKGMAKMVRFLKEGNILALLIDQHMKAGVPLDFMGKPAYTALSAAEMALKYNALLVPVYGIRQPDGISFELQIEAPIAHTDATTMTQALNDSLAAVVDQHKEQWFWVHKRWKTADNVDLSTRPS